MAHIDNDAPVLPTGHPRSPDWVGHGRVRRWLARSGAKVTGADISAALIERARDAERADALGIRYLRVDAAADGWLPATRFELVTCNFGLSDIDDLDNALASVTRLLEPGGRFVFSILHPCFPGGEHVSGSWPTAGSYDDEDRWQPAGQLSSLRRQVGANHRTLGTYLTAARRHDLGLDAIAEPAPPAEWIAQRPDAARRPVFLAARFRRQQSRDDAAPGARIAV